jgi:hypothetical protein
MLDESLHHRLISCHKFRLKSLGIEDGLSGKQRHPIPRSLHKFNGIWAFNFADVCFAVSAVTTCKTVSV